MRSAKTHSNFLFLSENIHSLYIDIQTFLYNFFLLAKGSSPQLHYYRCIQGHLQNFWSFLLCLKVQRLNSQVVIFFPLKLSDLLIVPFALYLSSPLRVKIIKKKNAYSGLLLVFILKIRHMYLKLFEVKANKLMFGLMEEIHSSIMKNGIHS